MKKIFLILITIYTFSFSSSSIPVNQKCSVSSSVGNGVFNAYLSQANCIDSHAIAPNYNGHDYWSYTKIRDWNSNYGACYQVKQLNVYYDNCVYTPNEDGGFCNGQSIHNIDGDFFLCSEGSQTYTLMPPVENGGYNDDGSITCNNGFYSDGANCNALPENSSGFDESGNLLCNSPYVSNGTSCNLPPNTNPDGTCSEGSYKDLVSNSCQEIQTTDNNDGSTTTNDGNGETTDYPTGTTVNHNPETGVTTTTYPDGTSTITYPDGTSSTGGGTDSISGGNTGGGTGGGSEDTSGENNSDNGSNDLPSDNVANNCNDTNLTLQEKMLCELNEGMKKQNSEAAPTNSLNNLMKDLRDNQMQDNTAMNQNLKDIESLNKDIKALNNSQLSTLNVTKNATIVSTGLLNNIDTKLDNLLDSTAENVDNPISTVSDSFDSLTSSFSNVNSTYNSLNTEIYNKYSEVKTSIEEGFNFTLQSHEIVSCPINKTIDFSKLGFSNFDLNIDICYYTSQVKPYLYPILFILFSYGFSMSIFNMLRGV